MFAYVDGVEIPNARRYRVRTDKCFNIYERVPKSYAAPNAYPSASDGFRRLLPPLPKGSHTIKFGGRYNRGSGAYGRMVQDIEYQLAIE